MIQEPQGLEQFGFRPGYFIFRDGTLWSEVAGLRGKKKFKKPDYTGCVLLKQQDGKIVRRSCKMLAFMTYVVPELVKQGFVPIFDGTAYINRNGDVYSTRRGVKLVWQEFHKYFYVRIGPKYHLVHRLVAQTFLPNPDNLPEVDHKDGSKSDNNVGNLGWVDRSGNMKAAYQLGLLDNSLSKAFAAKGLEFKPKH